MIFVPLSNLSFNLSGKKRDDKKQLTQKNQCYQIMISLRKVKIYYYAENKFKKSNQFWTLVIFLTIFIINDIHLAYLTNKSYWNESTEERVRVYSWLPVLLFHKRSLEILGHVPQSGLVGVVLCCRKVQTLPLCVFCTPAVLSVAF